MLQQHHGYWISGTPIPGPPYTTHWETMGTVLKSRRGSSVIEIGRIQDNGCTFEL